MIKGTLYTLLAAAGFGAAAPLAKLIYSSGITPAFMLALRFSTAALILWLYVFIKRQDFQYKLEKKQLYILFCIGGIIYFLTTTFYFNAIKFIPVSLHVVLFYTFPFMVNIFSFVFLKEKLSIWQLGALLIAFLGIMLTVTSSNSDILLIGIVFSLLAALSNAAYILMLGTSGIRNLNSIIIAAYTNTFSGCSFIIYSIIKGEVFFDIGYRGYLGIGFIGLVSTAVSIIALSEGIRLIGPSKASIISTFEPLEGVVLSVLFLGESFYIKQIIGIIMIIISIIIINRSSQDDEENSICK